MGINNFEEAFSQNTGSCRCQCACGREYYCDDGNDFDWEDGELEALRESEAIGVEFSVGCVMFENVEYVDKCDCWRSRAKKIMGFLDSHRQEIARYFNLERAQAIAAANALASVEPT